MTRDPEWFAWSAAAVEEAANSSRLILNPIVYAEVSVRYSSVEQLEDAMPSAWLEREAIPFEAAFLAGKCYREYRRRGGSRSSILPDFLIGAHAAVAGYRLITRDASRYRTYFPRLVVVAPN
jgi:predicted nucleic acid-binding protein